MGSLFFLGFADIAHADPWSETATTLFTTNVNQSVGIGTVVPIYELHAVSNQGSADPFYFSGYKTTTGERDIFTIKDLDTASDTQDESSVLKVIKNQLWNNAADGSSLLELTHADALPTVADRQFYVLGRGGNDEGSVSWGIALTDGDFWTQGSMRGGAIGTDCGGTGTACFSNASFQLSALGDSYINGGNVGIGTATPVDILDIVSTGNTKVLIHANDAMNDRNPELELRAGNTDAGGHAVMKFSRTAGIAPDALQFQNSSSQPVLTMTGTGGVGIGTTTPNKRFTVMGGGINSAPAEINDAGNNAWGHLLVLRTLGYGANGANILFRSRDVKNWGIGGEDSGNAFQIREDVGDGEYGSGFGDVRFHVAQGGNIGIGTVSPDTKLHVTVPVGVNDIAHFRSDHADTDVVIGAAAGNIGSMYTRTGQGLSFGTNGGVERMRITSGGNVGIGTDSPSFLLTVNGQSFATDQYVENSGGGMGGVMRIDGYGDFLHLWSNTNTGTRIGNDIFGTFAEFNPVTNTGYVLGNMGIGTSTPSERLNVSGNIRATGTICDSVGCIGSSSSGGDNLGSHIATQNIQLRNYWLSRDGDNEGISITSAGEVGIGTSSPDKKLVVNGNMRVDSRLYGPTTDDLSLYSESGRDIKFYTNGTAKRMHISSAGYTSIKADPDARYSLRVDNQSTTDGTSAIAGHSWADTGNTTGVFGLTDSNGEGSGSPAGVFGWATNTSEGGDTFGVLGRTSTRGGHDPDASLDDTAVAVYGEAVATAGMNMGVWGETFSSTNGASGVRGVANTSSGVVYGVHGAAPPSGYAVFAQGTLSTSAAKPAVVYTEMQGPTEVYSMESPDIWFEDIQFGELKDGRAHIELDPLFRQTVTIDAQHPFHVFVQTYDAPESEHLTVHKTGDSFDVLSVGNPSSTTMFSYRILAKRRFYENRRLKPVGVPVDQYMRPDLSQGEIDALNRQLHLYAPPQHSGPLNVSRISE